MQSCLEGRQAHAGLELYAGSSLCWLAPVTYFWGRWGDVDHLLSSHSPPQRAECPPTCPASSWALPLGPVPTAMGTPSLLVYKKDRWRRYSRVSVGPGDPPQARPVTQHTSLTTLLDTHYSWCLTGHVLHSWAVFRLALELASAFVVHLGRLWWSEDQSFLCGLWVLSLSERSFLGTMVKRSLTPPTPASVRLDQNPDPLGAGAVCI